VRPVAAPPGVALLVRGELLGLADPLQAAREPEVRMRARVGSR